MTNSKDPYVCFTVCNIAYLPKALVLAESYFKYQKQKILIYICDRKINLPSFSSIAEIKWIEDLSLPNIYELAFKYDITEFSTSLKPYITTKLLEEFKKVIFLDPDTCLYHDVDPILEMLNNYPIVITPHYTTPEPETYPNCDVGMMRFGSFNLGFYAVKKSLEAKSFLDWWDKRCQRFGFFETQFGLSTDQKWVSIAPCFFPNLHISFNLGLNVAFWNIRERQISVTSNGEYKVNNTYPLIFFHFSSFDEENPVFLTKRPLYYNIFDRNDVQELSKSYRDTLKIFQSKVSYYPYSFDYMSNGEYISPTLRRAYACVLSELPIGHDPFYSNGPIGVFAKKNHLFESNQKSYKPAGFKGIKDHKKRFLFINLFLRILLRFIGPNGFSNLSRLMVYLSSFRQNRQLWKL